MWARIIDQSGVETVAEVVVVDPATIFTPAVAAMFVPATGAMVYRAEKRNGVWVAPPPDDPVSVVPVEPVAPVKRTLVSPVEYFGLFTPLEEHAIRKASDGETDASKTLAIFLRRLDHPSLASVDLASAQVQQGLGMLVQMGLITAGRKAEIEQGV